MYILYEETNRVRKKIRKMGPFELLVLFTITTDFCHVIVSLQSYSQDAHASRGMSAIVR